MKKNLLKELQGQVSRRKEADKNNSVISEVNKLLEYDGLRDAEILKSIGSNTTLVKSEEERGMILELEKKEEYYSGNVFTKDQIVQVGAKYRLKFLPSSLFSSYMTPLVASDVKELERNMSVSMTKDQAKKRNMSYEDYVKENGEVKFQFDAYELKNKFYVLAPATCFKLEKVKAFTLRSPDPILFYQIDDRHYRVVRKWGADFTVFRRLRGLIFINRNSLFLSIATAILATSLSFSATFSWYFLFLIATIIPTAIIFYNVDFEKNFFGKNYVTGHEKY